MSVGENIEAIVCPADEGGYVITDPETRTTTQGETIEEAVLNLREAVELYLEDELGYEK